MTKIAVTAEQLRELYKIARRNNKLDEFCQAALEWADSAQAIGRQLAATEDKDAVIRDLEGRLENAETTTAEALRELDELNDYYTKLMNQLKEPSWVSLEGMSASEIAAYDYGSKSMQSALARILDGEDVGQGVCNEPWQSLRERVIKLVHPDE